jgi:hypothetical protein
VDSYIIRIYQKKEDDPKVLVGTAEKIGENDRKAFKTLRELWEILNPQKRGPRQSQPLDSPTLI